MSGPFDSLQAAGGGALAKLCVLLLLVVVLVCSGIILSCGGFGPGIGDYEYDVSGGYQVVHFNALDIKVVPKTGWNKRKSGQLVSAPIIPSLVVAIAWNENVILAKQQHMRRKYPGDPQRTVTERDPGKVSYWILEVSEPRLHGPLDWDRFMSKRADLGIPDSLMLRNVSSYRK